MSEDAKSHEVEGIATFRINQPPPILSKWSLDGNYWFGSIRKRPNLFIRVMQKIILRIKWENLDD